jgi:SAM-dependent methyltransferase
MSDADNYAKRLAKVLDYENTFFDEHPQMDITRPDPSLRDKLDFIISSDVFEHVAPPVDEAFGSACLMLKPDGVMIFSIPYVLQGTTIEHYPNLYDFEFVQRQEKLILINRTRDGKEEVFDDLAFHGGPGSTLELRLFERDDLVARLETAGFSVKIYGDNFSKHGVVCHDGHSHVMALRRIPV